jgi:hypothetical protein
LGGFLQFNEQNNAGTCQYDCKIQGLEADEYDTYLLEIKDKQSL